MQVSDAELLLTEWGYWLRSGRPVPGYTSPAWAMIRDNCGSAVRAAIIEDDTAVLVDGYVARMLSSPKDELRDAGNAVVWYFGLNLQSYKAVGDRMEVNKDRVGALIKAGVAFVDGCLVGMVA